MILQHQFILVKADKYNSDQILTAVMNLVPWGWRSSSFWNMEGGVMEEGGVEEHRKDVGSLLLLL